VARAAARQIGFADVELMRQGLRLEPLLEAISDFLDHQHEMVERVRRDLFRGLKKPASGRRGLTPRQVLRSLEAVIPLRQRASGYADHDREKYKWRHLIENVFCCIKAFRRIAARYEKTDKCFAAIINLVASVLWIR
jgi:transposase